MEWRLADAKNKFSEVVNRALSDGPQRVSRRGDVVIVLAEADFLRLSGKSKSFKDFLLQNGPNLDGLDLTRDSSPMRDPGL